MHNNLAPLDLNQRYTVEETTAYLRQSRAKTYTEIRAGTLQSFTDGRRRYIPGSAIADRSRITHAAFGASDARTNR